MLIRSFRSCHWAIEFETVWFVGVYIDKSAEFWKIVLLLSNIDALSRSNAVVTCDL